jgi:hypothetical protein
MNGKDGEWDLSDLEKEIDSTVDTLLVNKTEQAKQVTPPQKTRSPAQETDITDKPSFPFEKEIDATIDSFRVERTEQANQVTPSPKTPPPAQEAGMTERPLPPPPSTSQAQTMQPVSGELQQKLEEVEAQLLTLEWDISSKHINNAITHLQDLRKLSHVGDELEKVIILIQKVLHQLILDENTLTPAALKFLQKSWKAIKGMTDQRFSFEIDKDILVRELIAEFQKLRIDEAPQERIARREVQQAPAEPIGLREKRPAQQPSVKGQISFVELDNFMNKIENLVQVVNEERKRWASIYQEITNVKDDLQNKLIARENLQKESQEEIVELDKRLATEPYSPSDFELQPSIDTPIILSVSLFKVSGVIFGLPEKQIMRSFPIKKWVSEFFVERGKVKLKNNEIPLFDICQVFKLKPSTEENPHVLLLKGRENHPAAVIIDQAISREEIEFQSIEGRPYILGQGVSRSGRVWILDAEQISP